MEGFIENINKTLTMKKSEVAKLDGEMFNSTDMPQNSNRTP